MAYNVYWMKQLPVVFLTFICTQLMINLRLQKLKWLKQLCYTYAQAPRERKRERGNRSRAVNCNSSKVQEMETKDGNTLILTNHVGFCPSLHKCCQRQLLTKHLNCIITKENHSEQFFFN